MLLKIAILLQILSFCNGNQCFQPGTIDDSLLLKDWKIDSRSFLNHSSLGPFDCVRICKLYSLCNYVNFNEQTLECSLLAVNGQLISDKDYIHIDVTNWNDNMLDVCKNHNCPINTTCKAGIADFYCEPIGCNIVQVDNVNYTSFSRKPLWNFGETIDYACTRGYFTRHNVTCLTSGKWSEFTCIRFMKCKDNNVCSYGENKHYWIYFDETKKVQKIFCGVGVGNTLSLEEYNMASTPTFKRNPGSCDLIADSSDSIQGYTDYQKVRLQFYPVRIRIDLLVYSNSTLAQQYYGYARDCYARIDNTECGVIGKFIINTNGTGFRIKASVRWKIVGKDGVIANVTRSPDGNLIEGYCGGNCGGCAPAGDLFLESDPYYTPPFESAELPICRYPH